MSPGKRWTCAAVLVGAALLATAASARAAARELYWRALDATARLEDDGTLQISERQEMVLTGDWNGGERSFRLFEGQRLDVERVVRIDPDSGTETVLTRGDLDEVDHWNWTDGRTLRWRSRQPSDPPFDRTKLIYRLDYRLTGALSRQGDNVFRLNHDWAFAERDGVIEQVDVHLTLGENWRAPDGFTGHWTTTDLPPGQGFVVPLTLEAVDPALATVVELPGWVRYLLPPVLFLLVTAWQVRRRLARERKLGRLAPPAAEPIDTAWLEEKVLSQLPEVVGAAWSRAVGQSEVAALLARLTAEGKLASRVEWESALPPEIDGLPPKLVSLVGKLALRRDVSALRQMRVSNLHLQLLVDRATLADYERALIDKLFGDADTTDTRSVRERYARVGFDPGKVIRRGVEERVARIAALTTEGRTRVWWPTAALVGGGLSLLLYAALSQPEGRGLILLGLDLSFVIGVWLPYRLDAFFRQRQKLLFPKGRLRAFLLVWGGAAIAVLLLGSAALRQPWLVFAAAVAGQLLLYAGLVRSFLDGLAPREGREGIHLRWQLQHARDYFENELRQPAPRLQDAWYPYLLALGLAEAADAWQVSFGEGRTGRAETSSWGDDLSGDAGGGRSGGSWSGGGGAFGGAGASASFAGAISEMAAGVSSPSSSDSSSSSSDSGSSGGGGGGGW